MKRKYRKALLTVGVVCLIACAFFVPIFRVQPLDALGALQQQDQTVCVLAHEQTTGVGWVVAESNDPALQHASVILDAPFDPQLLRDSMDGPLAPTVRYLVHVRKYTTVQYEDTACSLVSPQEIAICVDAADAAQYPEAYRIADLSFGGIWKAICGVFVPNGHWMI